MLRLFSGLVPAVLLFLSIIVPTTAAADEMTSYPIVIKHAFGTTTIAGKPKRVATVAWANHEVPLALGVVPVGFAAANFGDDDGDGLLPWVAKRLAELKADKPVLFDEGDGIDFEAVAATQPDVILAAYSGLSQSDYDTLSQIAPVVAYPVSPWATDWRDMIRLNSGGLGMVAEGEALIKRIETEIAEVVAGHPQLKGKSAMFVTHLDATNLSVVNFYTANDSRVKFFADYWARLAKKRRGSNETGTVRRRRQRRACRCLRRCRYCRDLWQQAAAECHARRSAFGPYAGRFP